MLMCNVTLYFERLWRNFYICENAGSKDFMKLLAREEITHLDQPWILLISALLPCLLLPEQIVSNDEKEEE
jgi:hypothetical protein